MERIFDERTASDNKKLAGHSGSVYAVSFSPDRAYLLSSSDDGTSKFILMLSVLNVLQVNIIYVLTSDPLYCA